MTIVEVLGTLRVTFQIGQRLIETGQPLGQFRVGDRQRRQQSDDGVGRSIDDYAVSQPPRDDGRGVDSEIQTPHQAGTANRADRWVPCRHGAQLLFARGADGGDPCHHAAVDELLDEIQRRPAGEYGAARRQLVSINDWAGKREFTVASAIAAVQAIQVGQVLGRVG